MDKKWLDQHVEKEIDEARENQQIQLQQIIKEGFLNSGNVTGSLTIYEKDDERIFYDSYNDRIRARFYLNDLMTKL